MDKLKLLMSLCKCGVYVSFNRHRDYYETAERYLSSKDAEFDSAVKFAMINLDTIIEIQFYPDTPIGSYTIYHYELDMALDEALKCFWGRND